MKSFERNILKLAGIKPVHSTLIGNVEGEPAERANWLGKMADLGARGA